MSVPNRHMRGFSIKIIIPTQLIPSSLRSPWTLTYFRFISPDTDSMWVGHVVCPDSISDCVNESRREEGVVNETIGRGGTRRGFVRDLLRGFEFVNRWEEGTVQEDLMHHLVVMLCAGVDVGGEKSCCVETMELLEVGVVVVCPKGDARGGRGGSKKELREVEGVEVLHHESPLIALLTTNDLFVVVAVCIFSKSF
jgi:hypothetical protein